VVIEVKGLHLRRGRREILRGIDFRLAPGEFVGVLGPNGAGKSTLLAALSGELSPDAGEVLFAGEKVGAMPARERAKKLALLPQESSLHFPFTVFEVARMGRIPHEPHPRDDRIVEEALRAVGAWHLADRLYPTLSGGERQRVQFARVLTQLAGAPEGMPQALLLDEPTSALDLEHQHAILRVARDLCARGTGVIAILHDLDLASAYADRLLLLRGGAIAAEGTPWEVLTEERVGEVFGVRATVLKHPHADRPLVVTG
jgi:iron complex transport system ATP-binding protein